MSYRLDSDLGNNGRTLRCSYEEKTVISDFVEEYEVERREVINNNDYHQTRTSHSPTVIINQTTSLSTDTITVSSPSSYALIRTLPSSTNLIAITTTIPPEASSIHDTYVEQSDVSSQKPNVDSGLTVLQHMNDYKQRGTVQAEAAINQTAGKLEAFSETEEFEEVRYQKDGIPMSVDYSSHDFNESRAIIDAASRDNAAIRRHGDVTVITEYRDPYSFYWQLDQARPREEEPQKVPHQTDYVIDEEIINDTVLTPDSHDSGINIESQYSRPMRTEGSPPLKPLPPGWERHEDPSGFSYYWHVDSGTIQREPPLSKQEPLMPEVRDRETQADGTLSPELQQQQQIISLPPLQPVIEERAFKQTTVKRCVGNEISDEDDIFGKSVRFAVRSLGWTEIAEEDLTPEKSSRAVNKAIVDLSTGRNDIIDNVSKWGDGRELIMELNDYDLTLIDPDTLAVIHSERIQQIRVWGVGRDNGRDFAYVARDRNSRRFMCHVFRCDTPARTIANALRDICNRLMLQKRPGALTSLDHGEKRLLARETHLPTPIEEPKKTVRCHFLGVTQVPKATGIEVLNEAVDRLVMQVRPERWILADVAIAPSTITITEVNGNQIAQCRVRYLSFLGIGRDVKHCAFIMHTSSENFMCYVFHVEPSAGPMAKVIEAACKLRYQKVLDAHASGRVAPSGKVP